MSYAVYLNRPDRRIRKELVTLLSLLVQFLSNTKEVLRINKRNRAEADISKYAKAVTSYEGKITNVERCAEYIPAWQNADEETRKMYAEDAALILGANFTSPVKFLLTFAGRNSLDPIIILAKSKNISIINLSDPESVKNLALKLKEKQRAMNPILAE